MGFPATPRGMMRRDGEEDRAEGAEAEAEGADDDEVEGDEEEGEEEAAAAAAEAPWLFLEETAEAAFIFGLRRTGTYDFFVCCFPDWRETARG